MLSESHADLAKIFLVNNKMPSRKVLMSLGFPALLKTRAGKIEYSLTRGQVLT